MTQLGIINRALWQAAGDGFPGFSPPGGGKDGDADAGDGGVQKAPRKRSGGRKKPAAKRSRARTNGSATKTRQRRAPAGLQLDVATALQLAGALKKKEISAVQQIADALTSMPKKARLRVLGAVAHIVNPVAAAE